MSIHPQRPKRRKDPWRLPRLRQAAPHLGEGQRNSWLVLGGIVLVLGIIAVAVLWPIVTRTFSPAGIVVPPTRTSSPPVLSPIPTLIPATATVPPPTVATVKYRVRSGDTLSAIAVKYQVSVRAIMQINNLKDETIYADQELLIPRPTPTP